MNRLLLFTVPLLLLTSCNKKIKSDQLSIADSTIINPYSRIPDTVELKRENFFNLQTYLNVEIKDTSEVALISANCAVLIYPSDKRTEEMIKEYGEDDFRVIADDNNWYQSEAMALLDSLQIKTIYVHKPYIKFIGSQQSWTLNMKRKGLPAWNIILFNEEKIPEVVSAIGLRDYFNRKQ